MTFDMLEFITKLRKFSDKFTFETIRLKTLYTVGEYKLYFVKRCIETDRIISGKIEDIKDEEIINNLVIHIEMKPLGGMPDTHIFEELVFHSDILEKKTKKEIVKEFKGNMEKIFLAFELDESLKTNTQQERVKI